MEIAELDANNSNCSMLGCLHMQVGWQEMQPQMPSVSNLWLALDYTALRGMGFDMVARVVQQMLRRFPCLKFLTIEVCNVTTMNRLVSISRL
jgi:hypothetical protein